MDRQIIYPGAVPLETDLLNAQKNDMIALSKLAASIFGTSTFVNGLVAGPNAPAALNVVVTPGEIYSLQNIDGTAYSSIAADTLHQIMKQGILLDAVTLATPAPATGGQSINYLIQATYTDTDSTPVVLPYYNASNPAQAYSGPANAGTSNNTKRQGLVILSAKVGIAAATGTQTTPAPDASYTGLYVVTVANGQATVTAGNIAQAITSPALSVGVALAAQTGLTGYGLDTGVANAYQVAYAPAISTVVDGMCLKMRVKVANTGASTFSPNGLAAVAILGGDHSPLTGGEVIANSDLWLQYNSALAAWVLIDATGGFLKTPTPAMFDSSQKVATTNFVKNSGMTASAVSVFNASATLTSANCGQSILANSASPLTITLPVVATCPVGSRIEFYNASPGALTVVRQGTDAINTGSLRASMVVLTGDSLVLESYAGNQWLPVSGSAMLPYSAMFISSGSAGGYQRLPSGIIIQWCSGANLAATGNQTVTLPIAFPNTHIISYVSSGYASANQSGGYALLSLALSSVTIGRNNLDNGFGVTPILLSIGF